MGETVMVAVPILHVPVTELGTGTHTLRDHTETPSSAK